MNYEQSFHTNKKVISFKAQNDGSNNYRYRFGIQLDLASNKNHTIAIEQLFTNQSYWNKSQINITWTGISIPCYHSVKYNYDIGNTENYYTKTIVQFKKLTAPQHRLYCTTHIDGITNAPNELSLNLVVYGVDAYQNNVDSSVYNITLYETKNDGMTMKVDIELNDHDIYDSYSNKVLMLGDAEGNVIFRQGILAENRFSATDKINCFLNVDIRNNSIVSHSKTLLNYNTEHGEIIFNQPVNIDNRFKVVDRIYCDEDLYISSGIYRGNKKYMDFENDKLNFYQPIDFNHNNIIGLPIMLNAEYSGSIASNEYYLGTIENNFSLL